MRALAAFLVATLVGAPAAAAAQQPVAQQPVAQQPVAQQPVAVVVHAAPGAAEMHGSLERVLQMVRATVPEASVVALEPLLAGAACDPDQATCADAIVRALPGRRVLVVSLRTTRGHCEPIFDRHGRPRGWRTLRATDLRVYWATHASSQVRLVVPAATDLAGPLADAIRNVDAAP